MNDTERKAFYAMMDALHSIYEVDAFGDDGDATVNIDYKLVELAYTALDDLQASKMPVGPAPILIEDEEPVCTDLG